MATVSVQASPGITLWRVTHVALWTIALSLPQGLLALPIAVAKVSLGPGLVILLLVGARNTATIAWTAQTTAAYFAAHGTVPSLTVLAGAHLGPAGRRLALAAGATLFFLALLASLLGLARNLSELSPWPAWVWGIGCGLALLAVTGSRTALSTPLRRPERTWGVGGRGGPLDRTAPPPHLETVKDTATRLSSAPPGQERWRRLAVVVADCKANTPA